MKFKTRDILSILDGRLMSDIRDVHYMIDHIMGTAVFSHEIPMIAEICKNHLKEQFSSLLDNIPSKDLERKCFIEWIEENREFLDVEHEIIPLDETPEELKENPIITFNSMINRKNPENEQKNNE
jgi:hypothetical protein